jgi:hypothetical protein
MKKAWLEFIKSFKPTYSVSAVTYFVIPGVPVNKNISRHDFGKGEYEKAKEFYDKVVKKTKELGFSPAEVHLIKGKSNVIEKQQFGPLAQIQNLPMTVNS